MTSDPGQMTKVRVALLLGGDSSEREISFKSGMAMGEALSPARFHVTAFDVTARAVDVLANADSGGGEGAAAPNIVAAPDIDAARLSIEEYAALQAWWRESEADSEPDGALRRRIGWNELPSLAGGRFDVVLSGLHGGWGEDGTVQALLEVAGVPYVGSPQRASVVAIDKQLCKAVMRDLGIPAPRGAVVEHPSHAPPFAGPCVVNPNEGGSSVAVTMLRQPQGVAWQNAICAALNDGSGALVEEMIEGAEVTAAVLGEGQSARVLPIIEIVPQSAGGFYDYEAKYAAGGSRAHHPAAPAEGGAGAQCGLRAAGAPRSGLLRRVALR